MLHYLACRFQAQLGQRNLIIRPERVKVAGVQRIWPGKPTGTQWTQTRTGSFPGAVSGSFVGDLGALIRQLASNTPPGRVPSGPECRFCDIGVLDCPERVDNGPVPEGSTVAPAGLLHSGAFGVHPTAASPACKIGGHGRHSNKRGTLVTSAGSGLYRGRYNGFIPVLANVRARF